jgi:hypothetical protein
MRNGDLLGPDHEVATSVEMTRAHLWLETRRPSLDHDQEVGVFYLTLEVDLLDRSAEFVPFTRRRGWHSRPRRARIRDAVVL